MKASQVLNGYWSIKRHNNSENVYVTYIKKRGGEITMEKVVEIGIEKIIRIKKMATLIKTTEKKEDILYIFERMKTELSDGIMEIEQIEKNID